jgi:hypothetical protein
MLSALLLVLPPPAPLPPVPAGAPAGAGLLLAQSPGDRGGVQGIDASALGRIAQGITVRLEGATRGSGVLVARDGRHYTVLTAWHVVRDNRPGEDIVVITPDGLSQTVQAGSLRQLDGIDLAVLSFPSDRPYPIAQLGQTNDLLLGSALAVAGFPSLESGDGQQPLRLKLGQLEALLPGSQPDGYQLLYSNETLPGMSGGPVLNSRGELVGIHGRAELHAEASRRLGKPIASSTNMGLTIAPFKALQARGQGIRSSSRSGRDGPSDPFGSLFGDGNTPGRDAGFTLPNRSPAGASGAKTPGQSEKVASRGRVIQVGFGGDPRPQGSSWVGLSSLERALRQGEHQQADQLTRQLLLAEPGQGDWLTPESVERLPCALLLAIDTTWRHHSQQRFGFSIQRSLWQGDFQGFATLAGWRRGGFVNYARDHDPNLPPGYYPRRVADGPIIQHLLRRVGHCLSQNPQASQ